MTNTNRTMAQQYKVLSNKVHSTLDREGRKAAAQKRKDFREENVIAEAYFYEEAAGWSGYTIIFRDGSTRVNSGSECGHFETNI